MPDEHVRATHSPAVRLPARAAGIQDRCATTDPNSLFGCTVREDDNEIRRTRCLGDCNVGNVLVHHGEVTGYIDLDHLPHGPRVRDLSHYLHSRLQQQIIAGDPDAIAAVLRHFVAGYDSTHPLTEHELAAVVPLLLTALVCGAGWCLHGRVPDPTGYQDNRRAIEWVASRYHQLVNAAAP